MGHHPNPNHSWMPGKRDHTCGRVAMPWMLSSGSRGASGSYLAVEAVSICHLSRRLGVGRNSWRRRMYLRSRYRGRGCGGCLGTGADLRAVVEVDKGKVPEMRWSVGDLRQSSSCTWFQRIQCYGSVVSTVGGLPHLPNSAPNSYTGTFRRLDFRFWIPSVVLTSLQGVIQYGWISYN
jgi:hypothetical protein